MGFLDSYKRLEKLCGDLLQDDRRVSAYIDEMLNAPDGASCVKGWNDDLKKLKHYRWIRNQISHEPECTEETMCKPGDVEWIEDFYFRILNQTDPVTLYRQAIMQRNRQAVMQRHSQTTMQREVREEKKSNAFEFWVPLILGLALVLILLLWIAYIR